MGSGSLFCIKDRHQNHSERRNHRLFKLCAESQSLACVLKEICELLWLHVKRKRLKQHFAHFFLLRDIFSEKKRIAFSKREEGASEKTDVSLAFFALSDCDGILGKSLQ